LDDCHFEYTRKWTQKKVENINFLSVNSKKNVKKFEKSAKFSKPQIWEKKKEKKEEEENPSEYSMRSSLFLLAKSSQKAILKFKIAEMKCFFEIFNSQNMTNFLSIHGSSRYSQKYRRMFYKF
jgi:hypothetical protein